jgi:hypothetical protein
MAVKAAGPYAISIGLPVLPRTHAETPPDLAKSDTLTRVPAAVSPASTALEPAVIVSTRDVAPWQHVLVLIALTAIYTGSYAFSIAIPDSTRDIYIARAISVGESFPLEGPVLGDSIHGGPVWFYLLAIPLWFYQSWLVAALFAGAIAGLKYLLAYVCGGHLVDRRFGLLWASALALPGWQTIEQIAFTNANVAQTCILASLYFGIRMHQQPSLSRAFVLGIAGGLAFHGHPTTLPVIPLSLALAIAVSPPHRRTTAALGFLAGCITPFTPYLASQLLHGFPDFATGMGYVQTKIGLRQIANAFAIVRSTAFDGPTLIARYVIGVEEPLLWAVKTVVTCFVVAMLVATLWAARRAEGRATLWFVAAVAIFAACIAYLRPTTPVYFAYVLIPAQAAVLALGVHVLSRGAAGTTWVSAFAVLALSLHALVTWRIGAAISQGVGTLPDVGNIVSNASSETSTNVWFPSYAHDASGLFLCRQGDRSAVHGPLAFVTDLNLGVDSLIRCGRITDVQLSGTGDSDRAHWVGMPKSFWSAARLRPSCWIGPLGLVEASSRLAPADGIAPASPKVFLPRPFLRGPLQEQSITFTAPGTQALVLTNVIPWYMPWRVLSVHANGRELSPVASTSVAQLYALPGAARLDTVKWEAVFAAVDTSKIDVVTVESSTRPEDSAPLCADQG